MTDSVFFFLLGDVDVFSSFFLLLIFSFGVCAVPVFFFGVDFVVLLGFEVSVFLVGVFSFFSFFFGDFLFFGGDETFEFSATPFFGVDGLLIAAFSVLFVVFSFFLGDFSTTTSCCKKKVCLLTFFIHEVNSIKGHSHLLI